MTKIGWQLTVALQYSRFVAARRTEKELYETMRDAIAYLRAHPGSAPKDAARAVGMSESRFAHAFRRWVGISPKRFLSHLTHERAKEMLKAAPDILSASIKIGLSGPGRLHSLMVEHGAVAPGEYKRGDFEIRYGIHATPFGSCVIGITKRGVCALSFLPKAADRSARQIIFAEWPQAALIRDDIKTGAVIRKLFSGIKQRKAVPLVIRGTNFQIQVWQALLAIPAGRIVSYADIAKHIGKPRAVRAVGTAIGLNRIAYLIPCHRVLTSRGALGGYRWGIKRKDALLAWEQARH